MNRIEVIAPDGAPEVRAGDDLVEIVVPLVDLEDGDVLVVTSKIVSKSEGRVRPGTREEALAEETVRVVARRGETAIVRTRHGLTLAAAGIDGSNVEAGSIVLLPEDPDASARALRTGLRHRTGQNVAVVVTDTAGRAWREGQTDIAIGAAGLQVAESYAGRTDAYGNELEVTAPAVADEIAGAAELAQGKLGGRPVAVVRGRADLVLPAGDHGPGARELIRPDGADMFGYGAREAVVRALQGDPTARRPFGAPAAPAELAAAITTALGLVASRSGPGDGDLLLIVPKGLTRSLATLTFAYGWDVFDTDSPSQVRLRPARP